MQCAWTDIKEPCVAPPLSLVYLLKKSVSTPNKNKFYEFVRRIKAINRCLMDDGEKGRLPLIG